MYKIYLLDTLLTYLCQKVVFCPHLPKWTDDGATVCVENLRRKARLISDSALTRGQSLMLDIFHDNK
jgi:hypothetical protein